MSEPGNPEKGEDQLEQELHEFSETFSEGQLARITESEIPEDVRQRFERRSQLFIRRQDYRPGNFEGFFAVQHTNGDRTYLACQTKTYDTGDTESLTYFVDTRDGQDIGHSELRFNVSNPADYFKQKPFVGYTHTEEAFRRQGLGLRRLEEMNAFTQAHFHLPLYSDTLNAEEGLWEDLVAQGRARKFKEGRKLRYAFLPRPNDQR